ncbi:MAG: nucleotidyltransferase [Deltaproteobacteria bacterium]|nr:nucleotidyltransferase [Deltaproteobacteria bacterium]
MDIESLLKLLKENDVDFVVIGASAFPTHGYARATVDIDLFIRKTVENAQKTLSALKKFGYDVTDLTADDLLKNKVLIRQYVVETDIHPFVTGITFDDVWAHKVKDKIGDVEVYIASLDDLIKMKKAAGRDKDLEDLKILEKLKKNELKPATTDSARSGDFCPDSQRSDDD